jgi:hypothetical protein
MTSSQAYLRRKSALSYLQEISRPIGNFSPEARAAAIAKARKAYQDADALYRKLSIQTKGE